jgi:3-oxoacyl-[acyl-carrier protein] reductase
MTVDYGLAGKHALVTGGSHGIGLAIAEALAGQACHVALCSRSETLLTEAKTRLMPTGVDILTIAGDVLKPSDIDRVTHTIDSAWGGIDVLINNVGGGGRWGSAWIEDTAAEVWDQVYQKNAGAAAAFTRWAIPGMRRRRWGRVVAVASIYGREGGGRPWFTAAKAAQIATMKTLAMTPYLARDGLTFNSVAPGSIMIPDTGWAAEQDRDPVAFQRRMEQDFPLGRLGTAEEVAAVVLFLCSRHASLVNGACITADGGESSAF